MENRRQTIESGIETRRWPTSGTEPRAVASRCAPFAGLLAICASIFAQQPDSSGKPATPSAKSAAPATRIGRPASPEQIKALDITVLPSGAGLPHGSGTAAKGKDIYKEKCATCHNDHLEGRENQYPALAGGIGTLNTPKPIKTVGSYWPYATSVFEYVRRAMPYDQPGTLKTDEIYSLVAFILNANGIVGENDEMNEKTLPQVKMPNRDGFIPDARPDVKSKR